MSADSEKPNIIGGNWIKYCTVAKSMGRSGPIWTSVVVCARVACALQPVRSIPVAIFLPSRCAERCAKDAFLTSFRATLRAQWLISLFLVLHAHWFSAPGVKKKQNKHCLNRGVRGDRFPPALYVQSGGCCSWRLFHFHADVIDHPRCIDMYFERCNLQARERSTERLWPVRPHRAEAHHQWSTVDLHHGVYSRSTVRVSHIMLEFFGFNAFSMSRKNHV